MTAVRRELSKSEVELLFVEAVDGALADADVARFQEQLASDSELKARYDSYQRAVNLLRAEPRQKAPDALASVILRRTRRRRSVMQSLRLHEMHFNRVPAEVFIPLLLAAAVALFLMTASP